MQILQNNAAVSLLNCLWTVTKTKLNSGGFFSHPSVVAYVLGDAFPRPEFDDFPLRPANSMRPEMCHLLKFQAPSSSWYI